MTFSPGIKLFNRLKRGLRPLSFLFIILEILLPFSGEAARNRFSYEEDKSVVLREILDGLEDLRHEVSNHETEIRTFDERFKNQDEILDSVRQQTADAVKIVKEALKNQTVAIESRLSGHDQASKGFSSDLRTQAQETASILSDYKSRILDLEKSIEIQNRNIDHLQNAVKALAEAIQSKDLEPKAIQPSMNSAKIYKVKAGDSLEKIAKQNGTSVKKLKEMNHLTSDQIIVGQKLQLPEE